jgi:hypothetical protein
MDAAVIELHEKQARRHAWLAAHSRFGGVTDEKKGFVWVCYIGEKNDGLNPTPIAAFTHKEYAIALNESLDTEYEPAQVSIKKITLPIDKYVPHLKDGYKPFDVSLMADGSFFDGTESYVTVLDEMTLQENYAFVIGMDEEKRKTGHWGPGGIIWAYTKDHAEELAEDRRRALVRLMEM